MMFKCTRSIDLNGERFNAGTTRVAEDHPILESHSRNFVRDPSGPGAGLRSEHRTRFPDDPHVYTGSETGFGEEQRARLLEAGRNPRAVESGAEFPVPGRRARDDSPGAEGREAGLRAIDSLRGDLSAQAGDRLDDLVRRDRRGVDSRYLAAVSDPAYNSAFGKKLLDPSGARDAFTDEEVRAVRMVRESVSERAMTVGTGSEGGFAVPATLDPTVIPTSDGRTNPIRALATTVTIATDTWQGVSSEGVVASWDPEATEVSDDSPTLAQPEITPKKLAMFVPFSVELGADWPTLQAELTKLFADAKDELEAEAFIGGTAAAQPQGLLVGGTIGVTGGTAGTAIPQNLYSLQQDLPPRYQPVAGFLSSNTFMNRAFRSVPEASTSEPKFIPEDRTAILGKPWYEVSHMATAVAGTVCAYGDVASAYRVVDRVGLSVELIPHLFGSNRRPTGQRGLWAYSRVGGGVVNPNAVRRLVTS